MSDSAAPPPIDPFTSKEMRRILAEARRAGDEQLAEKVRARRSTPGLPRNGPSRNGPSRNGSAGDDARGVGVGLGRRARRVMPPLLLAIALGVTVAGYTALYRGDPSVDQTADAMVEEGRGVVGGRLIAIDHAAQAALRARSAPNDPEARAEWDTAFRVVLRLEGGMFSVAVRDEINEKAAQGALLSGRAPTDVVNSAGHLLSWGGTEMIGLAATRPVPGSRPAARPAPVQSYTL